MICRTLVKLLDDRMQTLWMGELPDYMAGSNNALWLTKPYVLSRVLKNTCQTLEVKVIAQQFEPLLADEQSYLHQQKETSAWVRQVVLITDGQAATFGRVVVPAETYLHHAKSFESLGGNLIGETLLYSNKAVNRDPFEYARILPNHPICSVINEQVSLNGHAELWARRSRFWLAADPLMVMEVFLPDLPEYPHATNC